MGFTAEEDRLRLELERHDPNHWALGIFYSNTWNAVRTYRKAIDGCRELGRTET